MDMVLTQTTRPSVCFARQEHSIIAQLLPVTLAVLYNTAMIALPVQFATFATMTLL